MARTPVKIFDPVCSQLAAKISEADRHMLMQLSKRGHRMIVLSCGTANLSEGTLQKAGLNDCFEFVAGNRFEIKNGQIDGMTLHIPNPADKVRFSGRTTDRTRWMRGRRRWLYRYPAAGLG